MEVNKRSRVVDNEDDWVGPKQSDHKEEENIEINKKRKSKI